MKAAIKLHNAPSKRHEVDDHKALELPANPKKSRNVRLCADVMVHVAVGREATVDDAPFYDRPETVYVPANQKLSVLAAEKGYVWFTEID